MCQRMKNRMEIPTEKLKLSKVPKKLWKHLTVDFITKLPLVARKDVILVVYDKLSKITHFVATMKETLVKELVRLFRDNMWKFNRLPESIVLDRGLQFTVEITRKLNRMLEIETKLLMLLYSQTDGQIEIFNN